MTSNTYPPTVNIHGAADILKVHAKTVEDLIAAGVLRAAKVGRAWVLLTADVVNHVEQQIIDQTAARMGTGRRKRVTKAPLRDHSRGGSRSASSSGASGAR